MPKIWSNDYLNKYIKPEELIYKVSKLREAGKKITTLNGSFDLLHAGHLQILYEASQQGGVLIVALNSDDSIKQYKSPLRPIIPLTYRLQMMSALSFVDYVTHFDETDPRKLLSVIRPEVHVNGAEYGEKCIESKVVEDHGGRIHIVQLVPGLSTSEILKKISVIQKQER